MGTSFQTIFLFKISTGTARQIVHVYTEQLKKNSAYLFVRSSLSFIVHKRYIRRAHKILTLFRFHGWSVGSACGRLGHHVVGGVSLWSVGSARWLAVG